MKKRKTKILLSAFIVVLMLVNVVAVAFAADKQVTYTASTGKYTASKLSHPSKGSGEVDGIVDYLGNGIVTEADKGQGERSQSYAWSAIPYGDYVYVGTCYNAMTQTLNFMDSVLGDEFNADEMRAQLDVMFNGDFYFNQDDKGDAGSVLVKVNVKTGETKLLMSSSLSDRPAPYCYRSNLRNACEFNGKLYFCGSIAGIPRILEVNPENDECRIVYEGFTPQELQQAYAENISVTIRGLCVFNGKLVVSVNTLNGAQILIADKPEDGESISKASFKVIANQQDLFDYPAYKYSDSIYGGGIWEMVEFNNRLYVSLCTGTPDNKPDENSMQPFAVVRGDEQPDGSWTWTPIAGDKKDGAKYTFGIDPERTRAGACVLNVYGNYLYIGEYNDEQFALEGVLFDADFSFMNANLAQSVNLYRMDASENIELVVGDSTKMFPKGGISGLGSGFGRNENQYIWRMVTYNGKLYVGTFDTSSLLEPIGQLSNGDLAAMSLSDWIKLLGYVKNFIEISGSASSSVSRTAEDNERINALASLFEQYSVEELAKKLKNSDSAKASQDISLKQLFKTVTGLLTCADYMSEATRGFDLYVTQDGVKFETITLDGFGDPYNHGLRTFAATDSGLFVGTANPFYACQLWMLQENTAPYPVPAPDAGYDVSSLFNFVKTYFDWIIVLFKQIFAALA